MKIHFYLFCTSKLCTICFTKMQYTWIAVCEIWLLTQLVIFCLRSRRRCWSFGPGPERKARTKLRVFSRWFGVMASTCAKYFCKVVSRSGTGRLGRASSFCKSNGNRWLLRARKKKIEMNYAMNDEQRETDIDLKFSISSHICMCAFIEKILHIFLRFLYTYISI